MCRERGAVLLHANVGLLGYELRHLIARLGELVNEGMKEVSCVPTRQRAVPVGLREVVVSKSKPGRFFRPTKNRIMHTWRMVRGRCVRTRKLVRSGFLLLSELSEIARARTGTSRHKEAYNGPYAAHPQCRSRALAPRGARRDQHGAVGCLDCTGDTEELGAGRPRVRLTVPCHGVRMQVSSGLRDAISVDHFEPRIVGPR